jgi:EAL domain-containing protein (putative c-di-GMP-specific phosphodiesterase class I)
VQRLQSLAEKNEEVTDHGHCRFRYGWYAVDNPHMPVHKMVELAAYACRQVREDSPENYCGFDEATAQQYLQEGTLLHLFAKDLDQNTFRISYAVQADSGDGRPVGCEAQVYWRNPQRENVPRARFAPLLVDQGMLGRLDLYVLQQVCQFLRYCLDHEIPLVPVAVPISAQTLQHNESKKQLTELVDRYGLDHLWITWKLCGPVFSLTVRDALQQLREAGFSIAVEVDSVRQSILKEVQADCLYLDAVPLEQPALETVKKQFVAGMLAMAAALGATTIATGVTSEAVADFLRQHRCATLQGDYIQPLMSEHRLEDFLKESTSQND